MRNGSTRYFHTDTQGVPRGLASAALALLVRPSPASIVPSSAVARAPYHHSDPISARLGTGAPAAIVRSASAAAILPYVPSRRFFARITGRGRYRVVSVLYACLPPTETLPSWMYWRVFSVHS